MQAAEPLPETRALGSTAVNLLEPVVGTGVLEMGTDVVGVLIGVEPMATEEVDPRDEVAPRGTLVQEEAASCRKRIVPEGEIVLTEVGARGRRIDPEGRVEEMEGDGEMETDVVNMEDIGLEPTTEGEVSEEMEGDGEMASADAKR